MASVRSSFIFFALVLLLNLSNARRTHPEETSIISGNNHAADTTQHEKNLITVQGDDDDVDKVKSRVEPVDDNEAHSHKSYGSTYYNNDGVGSAYGWGSGGLNTPVSRSGSLSHCPVSPRHCLDPPTPTFGCSSCGHGWGFTTDNNGEYEQVGLDIQREATTAQKTADNIQKKFTVIKPHSILASRSAITPNHVDSPGPIPRAQKDVQLHELYFWRDGGEPDPRG